jgi:hypothetical protein
VLIGARRCLLDLQTTQRYLPARIRGSRCANYPLRARGPELLAELYPVLGNEGSAGTYRVAYVPSAQAPDTVLVAFTLSARPMTFGIDGLRSYLVDATGATHWTLADRDATVSDPVVSACETGSGTRCRYPGSGEVMDTTR